MFFLCNRRQKLCFSTTSGTLNIGTNGSITVSGSNYGTLSCSSSNTNIATCSVSGTTVTIVPKAVGTATITVSGAGGTNYNSISKTYAATVKVGESYVYWMAASGKETSKIKYSDAVGTASTIVRGTTPASICNSSVTSNYKFCAMFRDVYNSSNVYQYREGCIYEMATTKMACFKPVDFQPMSQAGDMIRTSWAVREEIRTELNSTFGLSLVDADCRSISAYGGVNYIMAACHYRPTSDSTANGFSITLEVGNPFNTSTLHVTPQVIVTAYNTAGTSRMSCEAYTGINYYRSYQNNYCRSYD